MKKISISDLQKIFGKIIKKLSDEEVEEIIIDYDFYNKIPAHKWKIYEQKIEDNIVMGSLYDDAEELKKVIQNEDEIFTFVDFDRTASILHYISEKLNPVE
jgi:hypothetical protein